MQKSALSGFLFSRLMRVSVRTLSFERMILSKVFIPELKWFACFL